MDLEELRSSGAVVRTSVVTGTHHIILCVEADQGTPHVFSMNVEQAVSLIAQLEAAHCCQFIMA